MAGQTGFLQPVGELADSAYTVEAIFGHAAPSPLVMAGGADDNYMEIGGYEFPHALMSGVVTVDSGAPSNPIEFQPSAKNLLRPMQSEGFWVLVLALIVLGLFSGSGNLKLGPVRLSGGVGGSA